MTKTSITISTHRAVEFRRKWHHLVERRATVDFECAELAQTIRAEFPAGASGDYQFRLWLRKKLKTGGRTTMLMNAAEAYRNGFHEPTLWIKLGGWPSISFLMGLNRSDRGRVLRASLERAEQIGSVSLSTVRKIAYSIGITTKRLGRPTRTMAEQKLAALRSYISKLLAKHPELPRPTKDVAIAMGSSIPAIAVARA